MLRFSFSAYIVTKAARLTKYVLISNGLEVVSYERIDRKLHMGFVFTNSEYELDFQRSTKGATSHVCRVEHKSN